MCSLARSAVGHYHGRDAPRQPRLCARRSGAFHLLRVYAAMERAVGLIARQRDFQPGSNGENGMANVNGRFVWYELMTTDMAAAKSFYTRVVGWGTEDASMPGMAYTLFTVKGASVGGLHDLPEAASRLGERPRWVGHVAVDDVDAAAARVKELGGAVHVAPRDIPNVSRFAVVADPQMAMFILVKWLRPRREGPAEPNTPGRVGWHELLADDCEKAFAFYSDLFGWKNAYTDIGPAGKYQLFSVGGETIGGMFAKLPGVQDPFWLYYFTVGDIDAAANRVIAGGGQVLEGPVELPGFGWIVECSDPQGAVFGLEGKRGVSAVGYFERALPNPSDPHSRRWNW